MRSKLPGAFALSALLLVLLLVAGVLALAGTAQAEHPAGIPTQTGGPKAAHDDQPSDSGAPVAPVKPQSAPSGGSVPCTTIFTGTLDSTDPTLATRMFREDPPSTCESPHPCPGSSGTGPFYYDTYTVLNQAATSTCVTIHLDPKTCTSMPFLHASAYSGSFDPTNLCSTNYLGDIGSSPEVPKDFSVTIGAGQTLVIVVNAVTASEGGACSQYVLTVTGNYCLPPTPTPCPIQFTDADPDSPFYSYIRCLACRNVLSGYSGPENCPDGSPCFRPNDNITRGQIAKIISNAAGYTDAIPSNQRSFEDVPSSSPFWLFIERVYNHGAIAGYDCDGTNGEPTTGKCYRPGNNLTRGQLAKIATTVAGYSETPSGQTFNDVAPDSPFYVYIERAALHGIISGYPCGTPGHPEEPCPGSYFRPGLNVTRGQAAKIIAGTFFPGCETPARR